MVTSAAGAVDEGSVWWVWALAGLAAWMMAALLAAVVIGRGIRLADRNSPVAGLGHLLTTADLPASFRAAPVAGPARPRRRAVPMPGFGVAILAVAVGLEAVGFAVRLTGAAGPVAAVLSMDATFSLPRLFVAALFAAAGIAAVAGAGRLHGRRGWWLAVGLVAGGIAAVKAGSTVHSRTLAAVSDVVGSRAALLASAVLVAAVVAGLWFLSRHDRRDRRRVLGALALYGGASVGLSALSSAVAGVAGRASSWAAGATFMEEAGEALAGVGFLVAVLIGVAPRLALPGTWTLRRSADAHALQLPEQLPGSRVVQGG
jgi:hypothetical protein